MGDGERGEWYAFPGAAYGVGAGGTKAGLSEAGGSKKTWGFLSSGGGNREGKASVGTVISL